MPASIVKLVAAVAGLLVVAASLGLALRHAWIERKVAALTAPPATAFAAENAALRSERDSRRVVLIGDSSFARWPAAQLTGPWRFVNRGVGGETTGQVAQRFESDALDLSPAAIVVSAGGNDLVAAEYLDPVARRAVIDAALETLVGLAMQANRRGARILIATLPPPSRPEVLRLPVWRESLRDSVAAFNQRLRQYAEKSGIELVDFAAALSADGRRTPDRFRADALHLNAAGYDQLAETLRRALGN